MQRTHPPGRATRTASERIDAGSFTQSKRKWVATISKEEAAKGRWAPSLTVYDGPGLARAANLVDAGSISAPNTLPEVLACRSAPNTPVPDPTPRTRLAALSAASV